MGKFIIRKTITGFKFDLKANNGETIATSEVYTSEQACLHGIESVKTNAPSANFEDLTSQPLKAAVNPKFEMFKDRAGELRFRLNARNGEIIATSEGYTAKASCLHGIESVRKNASEATIEKLY